MKSSIKYTKARIERSLLYYICCSKRKNGVSSPTWTSFKSLAHESGRVYSFPETYSEFIILFFPLSYAQEKVFVSAVLQERSKDPLKLALSFDKNIFTILIELSFWFRKNFIQLNHKIFLGKNYECVKIIILEQLNCQLMNFI